MMIKTKKYYITYYNSYHDSKTKTKFLLFYFFFLDQYPRILFF
jgi:hypothetical protein